MTARRMHTPRTDSARLSGHVMAMFLIAPLLVVAFFLSAAVGEPHVAESIKHAAGTAQVDQIPGSPDAHDETGSAEAVGSAITSLHDASSKLVECALFVLCVLALVMATVALKRRTVPVWFMVRGSNAQTRVFVADGEPSSPSLTALSISRT